MASPQQHHKRSSLWLWPAYPAFGKLLVIVLQGGESGVRLLEGRALVPVHEVVEDERRETVPNWTVGNATADTRTNRIISSATAPTHASRLAGVS